MLLPCRLWRDVYKRQHTTCVKADSFGKRHVQRWKCTSCKNRVSEPHTKLTRDTFLSNPEAAERALHCLLEGCSIRSTERLTGLNRNTIMRFLLRSCQRGLLPLTLVPTSRPFLQLFGRCWQAIHPQIMRLLCYFPRYIHVSESGAFAGNVLAN